MFQNNEGNDFLANPYILCNAKLLNYCSTQYKLTLNFDLMNFLLTIYVYFHICEFFFSLPFCEVCLTFHPCAFKILFFPLNVGKKMSSFHF